jgi:hypothetical protein
MRWWQVASVNRTTVDSEMVLHRRAGGETVGHTEKVTRASAFLCQGRSENVHLPLDGLNNQVTK